MGLDIKGIDEETSKSTTEIKTPEQTNQSPTLPTSTPAPQPDNNSAVIQALGTHYPSTSDISKQPDTSKQRPDTVKKNVSIKIDEKPYELCENTLNGTTFYSETNPDNTFQAYRANTALNKETFGDLSKLPYQKVTEKIFGTDREITYYKYKKEIDGETCYLYRTTNPKWQVHIDKMNTRELKRRAGIKTYEYALVSRSLEGHKELNGSELKNLISSDSPENEATSQPKTKPQVVCSDGVCTVTAPEINVQPSNKQAKPTESVKLELKAGQVKTITSQTEINELKKYIDSGQPVVIINSATWCQACKALKSSHNDLAQQLAGKDIPLVVIETKSGLSGLEPKKGSGSYGIPNAVFYQNKTLQTQVPAVGGSQISSLIERLSGNTSIYPQATRSPALQAISRYKPNNVPTSRIIPSTDTPRLNDALNLGRRFIPF